MQQVLLDPQDGEDFLVCRVSQVLRDIEDFQVLMELKEN